MNIAENIKNSKIIEFNDILRQRADALQKASTGLDLSEYETYLATTEKANAWIRIQVMLSEADIDEKIYNDFLENPTHYEIKNGQIVYNKSWEKEAEEAEKERINKLTMTALDFIGVLVSFGLTLEQIDAYLNANLSIKMQLQYCQNVYCGVAKSLMPITFGELTITAEMVEQAFRAKHGEV